MKMEFAFTKLKMLTENNANYREPEPYN